MDLETLVIYLLSTPEKLKVYLKIQNPTTVVGDFQDGVLVRFIKSYPDQKYDQLIEVDSYLADLKEPENLVIIPDWAFRFSQILKARKECPSVSAKWALAVLRLVEEEIKLGII